MKIKKFITKKNKALIIKKKNKKFIFIVDDINLSNLKKDEVVIKVFYTCFNFKDILVGKGNPGLVRNYPHIPGLDCTGKVYYSNSKKFKRGDNVMVIARPTGINSFGTMSSYFVCPSKWIEKIPPKINMKTPIIFGTAGFTAMLAVQNIINNKVKKNFPILVTGASGGVGLLSIFFLNNLGYKIIASTTNVKKNLNFLKKIGVTSVIDHKQFNRSIDLPILKMKYSAIIDNVGGDVVSFGSRELIQNGILISVGNVHSNYSKINILPFILRGIKLIGINAESAPSALRKKIWKRIYKNTKSKKLNLLYRKYNFNMVIKIFNKILKNNYAGRVIFKI
jgi:acrylyl-CoA reductase (NADPH)